jgi:hypothetical protein
MQNNPGYESSIFEYIEGGIDDMEDCTSFSNLPLPIFTLFATRPASTGQKIYFGIFNKHIGRNLDLFYR